MLQNRQIQTRHHPRLPPDAAVKIRAVNTASTRANKPTMVCIVFDEYWNVCFNIP